MDKTIKCFFFLNAKTQKCENNPKHKNVNMVKTQDVKTVKTQKGQQRQQCQRRQKISSVTTW